MRGVILQPTYLPWQGYFEMIDNADVFVVFDHVQFIRKSWHHRNKIKTANGVVWLTVPVQHGKQDIRICDAKIAYDQGNELKKHWETILFAYKKTEHFNQYKPIFEEIYSNRNEYLSLLNISIIRAILGILGIKTKLILSSTLNLEDENMGKTEKVINLCKSVGITDLYDANGAEEFIEVSLFQREGIKISFQNYAHPVYRQIWGDFVPYLSAIDLLFNEGDKGLNIIRSRQLINSENKKPFH